MAAATAIVPPQPRVVRVMRRLKTRRALQICIGATASTLIAALTLPAHSRAALIIFLAGIACVSGMAAVVLRFVEKPREMVLQAGHYDRSLIH